MGFAVFVAVEREFENYDPASVMGKALAAAIEQLDDGCERMGVATLSSFVSADPADLEAFTSDEPPLTEEQAAEDLAAMRKLGGVGEELAAELEALVKVAASAELEAAPMPEQWFDPEAALISVRAVLSWLQQSGAKLSAKPFTREDVIADLRSVESTLSAASRASVRFHFAYDV